MANRKWQIARDLLLCFLSSFLLALSFPNFNLWPLAWIGFVPLFFAIQNKSKRRVFFLAYLCGVIFWSGTIYWLIHVTLPGTVLLVLYLALYFGLFGLLISYYTLYAIRYTLYDLLLIPSVWVLLEYIRSHLFTGFPWALLGYSQYLNLPVIQIADITGVWGVSFLVMMVNVLIYKVIGYRLWVIGKKNKILIVLPLILLILTLGYGYYHLNLSPITHHLSPIKISVIQGNIPQELKWDERYSTFILEKYLNLSRLAAKESPQIIVWSEAAAPGILGEDEWVYQEIFSLAKEIKIPLLVGAVVKDKGNYFGSALLIDTSGRIAGRYDKLHLVPFGEYIPLKNIFPFLETIVPIGDFTAGKEYTIFKIPNPKSQIPNKSKFPISKITNNFVVLICFEDLFPELSRKFVNKGADFLVNITNDAWYKKSSAPYQHLQASVFRAVENRVYLARATNTGVSGFISPTGKIISLVKDKTGREIFVDAFATQDIFMPEWPLSFYTRYGDILPFVCLLFIIYSKIITFKNKR